MPSNPNCLFSASADLSLRQHLSVPYRVEAATREREPGHWLRWAAYPELPECHAEADTIEAALATLERRRVEIIVALLRAGAPPQVPRPPLRDCDPEGVMDAFSLFPELVPLLDAPASQLASASATRRREGGLDAIDCG